MGTGHVSASQPRAAAPWEGWSAGSGVSHGRFLCLVSSSPLWSQRAGQSPGTAVRKAGGRGGRLASAGEGPGPALMPSSKSLWRLAVQVCPWGPPSLPLPTTPVPGPLPRVWSSPAAGSAAPACPGRGHGAHLGPTSSGEWGGLPAADGQMEPRRLPGLRGLYSPAVWSFLG